MNEKFLRSIEAKGYTVHGCYRARDGECYYLWSNPPQSSRDAELRLFSAALEYPKGMPDLRASLTFGVTGSAAATRRVQNLVGDLRTFIEKAGLQHFKAQLDRGISPELLIDPAVSQEEDPMVFDYVLNSDSPSAAFRVPEDAGETHIQRQLQTEILERLYYLHNEGSDWITREQLFEVLCSQVDWIDRAIDTLVSQGIVEPGRTRAYRLTQAGQIIARREIGYDELDRREQNHAKSDAAPQTVPIGMAESAEEALPITPVKTEGMLTAKAFDEATRQRFNRAPETVAAEVRRAKASALAVQAILEHMGLNTDEAFEAKVLLKRHVEDLDNLVETLESNGDTESARKKVCDQLLDVLENFLGLLSKKGPMAGVVASIAIGWMSIAGVQVGAVETALVGGSIIGVEAVLSILRELKKKDEGE